MCILFAAHRSHVASLSRSHHSASSPTTTSSPRRGRPSSAARCPLSLVVFVHKFLLVTLVIMCTICFDMGSGKGNEDETMRVLPPILNQFSHVTATPAFANATIGGKKSPRIRQKRSIVQLMGMMNCINDCDPLAYKSYGCYCGYLGEGNPVNGIDTCCFKHDWCYAAAKCPQLLVYFIPYSYSCHARGYATCDYVPYGMSKKSARCSYELCECDRKFAKCISQYKCPKRKAVCKSSSFIAMQNKLSDRLYNLI